MPSTLRKITSEPTIIILIITSLILIKLTFEKEIGTEIISIYLTMFVADFVLYISDKLGIIQSDVQTVSGNSAQALLWAGITLIGFIVLYGIVNSVFRQSVINIPTASTTVFQSVFQSTIKFSGVDFSKLSAVKYYLFGVLIPLIETRVLSRLYGAIGWIANINISDLKNPKTHFLITTVSIAFMVFHLKVRGINNNLDLVMTFLFAYVSLLLVAKFREIEPANEFHIGANLLAMKFGI